MPSAPILPPPELIVCDLAGTTVYDRGEVPAAFAMALTEAGVAFDPDEIIAWRGASKREVIARLLGRQAGAESAAASRLPLVYDRFRTLLGDRLGQAGPLSLPGVREAFERLRGHGIRVALTTGFDRGLVETILAAVEWAHLLDTWVCGDDVPAGRPAPFMIFRAMERCGVTDVRSVAVAGDTRLDLDAAWNAGVPWRIGVLTGAHDRGTLAGARSTHVLESIAEAPDLWLEA